MISRYRFRHLRPLASDPATSFQSVHESINEVKKTLIHAVILVAGVVLLFLQNWRSAIIPLVAVLPVLDGRLVLIRRFRHGTRSWLLEAPRGIVEAPATPADDARRELKEEIGASVTALHDLGEFHPSAGVIAESMKLYLAHIDRIGELETHEAITGVEVLTAAQADELIARGEVTDGPTLAAYLRARLRGLF